MPSIIVIILCNEYAKILAILVQLFLFVVLDVTLYRLLLVFYRHKLTVFLNSTPAQTMRQPFATR